MPLVLSAICCTEWLFRPWACFYKVHNIGEHAESAAAAVTCAVYCSIYYQAATR